MSVLFFESVPTPAKRFEDNWVQAESLEQKRFVINK